MRVMDIRSVRKGLGLSQADLAAKLGVTQGTISRFEKGLLRIDERTRLAVEALQLKEAQPRRVRTSAAA